MKDYPVKRYMPRGETLRIEVPASKSILNRALVLAALARGEVTLRCGTFGEDTRAMLECLHALGIGTEERTDGLLIHGCGGKIPNRKATLDVRSAGTAARFLTAALAVCGGEYTMTSSPQMEKRPMELLCALKKAGVRFEFFKESDHFPFRMHSDGLNGQALTVDTDWSTQYASGLMLAAPAAERPLTLHLTGSRTHGSYLNMTTEMLLSFGAEVTRTGDTLTVTPPQSPPPLEYEVEADLSGACYFFALALLFGEKVFVPHTKLKRSLQGDVAFLRLLEQRGVRFREEDGGVFADGSDIDGYRGFDEDVRDFSDQTLTLAALAPFATTPSRLRGVAHIRRQECDRVEAVVQNLTALGVPARAGEDDIQIMPAPVRQGYVRTFDDHRVAMAFTLVGLKAGGITIENPACTKKTFDGFFDIIGELTRK